MRRGGLLVIGSGLIDLVRLDDDVVAHLHKTGALLPTPIERLRRMNPLSIELDKRYKFGITPEPLPFAMNNPHMIGDIAVDIWDRKSLAGCCAVGEAAGTHGVTRPGGAARNDGQVFGRRCTEHIASRPSQARPEPLPEELIGPGRSPLAECAGHLHRPRWWPRWWPPGHPHPPFLRGRPGAAAPPRPDRRHQRAGVTR
ncbi:hypothetical protein [Leptothrix discophora]|uniref:Uncharacterized protein n=1 Tax=Leptothrix discophora TaxID=89 RepID=A0ABT9FXS6_LEPDI|nr:hypothetical protein [Leptothrix discophora]MDP4299039.1 hypothetical protein [Leptothrix discophora]